MQFLKQLSAVITVCAVLVLPLGVMGCADQASTPETTGTANPDGDNATDMNTDSDLGEPEAGSNL